MQGGRRNRAQDKGTLLRAVEDWPRAIGSPCHFADEGDAIQPSESREMGFATRELLLTRVNHLSAALAQLDAGEYGRCGEYGETISPARLLAMPEVQCCVRCQDRLEHLGPRMEYPEPRLDLHLDLGVRGADAPRGGHWAMGQHVASQSDSREC